MKRDDAQRFIDHLLRLKEQDRGALAALRHSLAFAPGDDPKAFPYVERFVGRDWHSADARRLALYAVAGLFAAHPVVHDRSLPAALGKLLRDKDRPSLELRFRALLEADADGLMPHLRQSVSLLSVDGLGYDHAGLLADLAVWLDERSDPAWRDDVKRRWARAFYGALQADDAVDATTTPTTAP
ncbi:MAG: type I-E CRISPR-associated protein Cse2/CasB [Burkholderiales bacterium]|nr:type I-E CRISPR-associated protein Cse2/CasB [Burkholderiales bacterium]